MISDKPVKEWINDFWEGFVEINEETLKQAIKIAVNLSNTPITKQTLLKIKK